MNKTERQIYQLMPRGIRNNNPGNIEKNSIKWNGMKEKSTDDRFCQFKDPVWGIRAIYRLLMTYYYRHGLNTTRQILNRYAPPKENDTPAYARHVAKMMGVGDNEVLDLSRDDVLIKLAMGIVIHENGHPPWPFPKHWYCANVYKLALNLAKEK